MDMEINYALIAFVMGDGEMDVLHFCGLKAKPLYDKFGELYHRLKTDPKYGLTDMKFEVTEASSAMVEYYKKLNPPDEDAYYIDDSGAIVKM